MVDFFREHIEKNDKIIGTSNTKWTVGFEKCDKGVVLPDILDEDYIPELLSTCKQKEIDVLLSFFDLDIHILSKYKKEFKKAGILTLIPDHETSQICFDKFNTFSFLSKNNINTPKTYIESKIDLNNINYPVIIKPRFGFGSNNIFIANNKKEIDFFLNYTEEEMIIQEKINGREYHLDILNNFNKEVVSVSVKEKLSMRSGETDQAKMVSNNKLKTLGEKLGKILEMPGPIDVDIFFDGEKFYVLEINPRFGGGYPFSHKAGLNHPGLIIEMLNNKILSNRFKTYNNDLILMKKYDFFNKEISKYDINIINRRK